MIYAKNVRLAKVQSIGFSGATVLLSLSLPPNTVKMELPDGSEAWYYLEPPSSSLT